MGGAGNDFSTSLLESWRSRLGLGVAPDLPRSQVLAAATKSPPPPKCQRPAGAAPGPAPGPSTSSTSSEYSAPSTSHPCTGVVPGHLPVPTTIARSGGRPLSLSHP